MLSIIIPTLNEAGALPATLKRLDELNDTFELIICDGGSSDATMNIARSFCEGCRSAQIILAPRGRASQMNAGAAQATGDWLLFLHADTLLPADAVNKIQEVANNPGVLAGCFQHRFSGDDWRLRFISHLHNWRFKRTLTIYGDQAMFVKRDTFFELSGFPEQTMEDVLFSERLLTLCQPVMLPSTVTTDSRKFIQLGVWRALFYVMAIQLNHLWQRPLNNHRFFKNYR